MLNKKAYIENHRKLAEKKLSARLEMLKSKGMTELQIQRDAKVKHFKAEVRKARHQLAGIADLEAQIVRKAEIKAEKLAAPRQDHPKHKRAADPAKKRVKREKKLAAAETASGE
jgi:hypothetical protein